MEERRAQIRVNIPVMVEFPNPATMKTVRSYTQNISEAGMRFPTEVVLSVSQELPITLKLPFSNDDIQATGEVIWVREIARIGGPQYEVGVRFQWMEDIDRNRLVRNLTSFFPARK